MVSQSVNVNVFCFSVTGPGREQPADSHRSAAEVDAVDAHHRVLQRSRQHGDESTFYGSRQQVCNSFTFSL